MFLLCFPNKGNLRGHSLSGSGVAGMPKTAQGVRVCSRPHTCAPSPRQDCVDCRQTCCCHKPFSVIQACLGAAICFWAEKDLPPLCAEIWWIRRERCELCHSCTGHGEAQLQLLEMLQGAPRVLNSARNRRGPAPPQHPGGTRQQGENRRDGFPCWVQVVSAGCLWELGDKWGIIEECAATGRWGVFPFIQDGW